MRRERVSRSRLIARLPDAGAPGWTAYTLPGSEPVVPSELVDTVVAENISGMARASATGSVLFLGGGADTLILPPFPVEAELVAATTQPLPLIELLERRRTVGVFLLRLGGFAAGVFRGDALIDSKTDRRFVKNRHRKGGQSQRRFDRIREKQVHLLFEKACLEAREKLEPYEDELEHVLLGGDRLTLLAFRKECAYFERYGERLMPRILAVPGDPRRATLDAMPREIWSSDVYTWDVDG